MKRCCHGECAQGRHSCPLRTVRIPTRRTLAQRMLAGLGAVCDRHPFLPLAVVLVALYFINS